MKLLVLFGLVALAYCQDDGCKDAALDYVKCTREKHDAHIEEKKEVMETIVERMKTECFTGNGCEAPDIQVPEGGDYDMHSSVTEEQKECIRTRMWEHKLDKVQECSEDSPEWMFDALKEAGGPKKAKFMAEIMHMKRTIKKALKTCRKDDRDAFKKTMKCLKELRKEKESHKQEMCVKHQECVNDAFTEKPECLDTLLDTKREACRCFHKKIAKPGARFVAMMKRRESWTDEERERIIGRLRPHLEACDVNVDEIVAAMTGGRRYRRYKRDASDSADDDSMEEHDGSDEEDDEDDGSDEGSDEGSRGGSGSRGSGSHGSGSRERGEGRKEMHGPPMCTCDVKRISETDTAADELEAAVASAFF